jgi:hypothetical protein
VGLSQRALRFWAGLKQGERIFFFMAGVLLVFGFVFWLLAITGATDIMRVRDIYEESPEADQGLELVKHHGCRNCHNVLNEGEWGLAPGLDGIGTRRTYQWIRAYLEDPARQMNGKTLHNGSYGPTFSEFTPRDKDLIATFLFAQKSLPGSPNYGEPPR